MCTHFRIHPLNFVCSLAVSVLMYLLSEEDFPSLLGDDIEVFTRSQYLMTFVRKRENIPSYTTCSYGWNLKKEIKQKKEWTDIRQEIFIVQMCRKSNIFNLVSPMCAWCPLNPFGVSEHQVLILSFHIKMQIFLLCAAVYIKLSWCRAPEILPI